MADFLEALAYQQLSELDPKQRIVVIHPQYTRQHLLLNQFLEQPNTLYLRFDASMTDRKTLESLLNDALHEQSGQGSLASIKTLILDECDRLSADLFNGFLPFLLNSSTQSRVVIFAREVPRIILTDEQINAQTVYLPIDDSVLLRDYKYKSSSPPLLEVRALGAGQVMVNGQAITTWDGILPRSLFFYLIDRGMATRSEIFETFWPRLSTREATNVFHVTKRKINELLGMDLTVYWSGFYRISPDIELSYDTMTFIDMVHTGDIAEDNDAERLITRALTLYRGHYLTTIDTPWAVQRRQELMQIYADALMIMARIKETRGQFAEALGLYLRAFSSNRHREDLVENTMRLCEKMGMPTEALTAYERLETALHTAHAMKPPVHLREMADAFRAQIEESVS
jgi:DNA-binding SARP family transcriptional activator